MGKRLQRPCVALQPIEAARACAVQGVSAQARVGRGAAGPPLRALTPSKPRPYPAAHTHTHARAHSHTPTHTHTRTPPRPPPLRTSHASHELRADAWTPRAVQISARNELRSARGCRRALTCLQFPNGPWTRKPTPTRRDAAMAFLVRAPTRACMPPRASLHAVAARRPVRVQMWHARHRCTWTSRTRWSVSCAPAASR